MTNLDRNETDFKKNCFGMGNNKIKSIISLAEALIFTRQGHFAKHDFLYA